MSVLWSKTVSGLETLAGNFKTLLGVIRDVIVGKFFVKKLND